MPDEEPLILPLRPRDDLVRSIYELQKPLDNSGTPLDVEDLITLSTFEDGEYRPKLKRGELISGRTVVLVNTDTSRENKNDLALARPLLLRDMLERHGVERVLFASFPFPYQRQDENPARDPNGDEKLKRKLENMRGEPFSLEAAIRYYHALGFEELITAECHNPQATEGIVTSYYEGGRFHNLDPFPLFGHLFAHQPMYGRDGKAIEFGNDGENVVIGVPDAGGLARSKRFQGYAEFTKADIAYFKKLRLRADDPDGLESQLENDIRVEGKTVIIPDDLYGRGGTLERLTDAIREQHPAYVITVVPYMMARSPESFNRLERNSINMWTTNFRPNIWEHRGYGEGVINALDVAPWLLRELRSIASGRGRVLGEKPVSDAEASSLYALRKPQPLYAFS